MKKLLAIFLGGLLFASCSVDEIEGPAAGFYPETIELIPAGTSAFLEVQVSGVINSGTVTVSVSNPEGITSVPAMENGKITLTFNGTSSATMIVTTRADYEFSSCDFTISNVSGDIEGISSSNKFTLLIKSREIFTLPFSDSFESCASEGQFNIPSNWVEENVPGFNTIRGWGCRNFGVDGSWAPRASAYISGSSTGADDSWLISNGVFDLSSVTTSTVSFYAKTQYSGPGKIRVYWSENYLGFGDPTAATWNEVTALNTGLDALTTSFAEQTTTINDAAGKFIYLAFRYTEGTGSSSIAIDVDDFSISGN